MSWKSVLVLFFLSEALGTPPGTENFYNYRADYDDDVGDYNNGVGFERKQSRDRDYNYEDEESDSKYRGSDDWIGGNRRGWSPPTSSFSFNRIPSRHSRPQSFQKPVGSGWDEEEAPWSPPPRRKPAYVVKVRRPVKKDPAWIYFRPPTNGHLTPGWNRPNDPISPPPIRKQRPDSKVASWEEEPRTGSHPKDASYSFAYDAGDHERSEYADPWGTVRGSYSYTDPTGVRRTVHYTAGAATGFKVLNSQPSNFIENVYRDPVFVRRKPSAYVYHLHPDGGWKPWEGRKEQGWKEKARTSKPLSTAEPEEELALDETRYEPQVPPQRKHLADQEQQNREKSSIPPTDQDDDKVDVRGYEGGYGDRNPLVVVDDKRISPGKMMALRMRRKKLDQDDERPRQVRPKQPSLKSQRQKPSSH